METVRERLKQLLMILLEAIETGEEPGRLDRGLFADRIGQAGYDVAEIGGILDWLEDHWLAAARAEARDLPEAPAAAGGLRAFGENEQQFLTPEAFGRLLDLRRNGQITAQQMESLIHYASLVSETPVDRSELEQLLDRLLFSFPGRPSGEPPAAGRWTVH